MKVSVTKDTKWAQLAVSYFLRGGTPLNISVSMPIKLENGQMVRTVTLEGNEREVERALKILQLKT